MLDRRNLEISENLYVSGLHACTQKHNEESSMSRKNL